MNHFKDIKTQITSEEFTAEFKTTLSFLGRVVLLIWLVVLGISEFVYKVAVPFMKIKSKQSWQWLTHIYLNKALPVFIWLQIKFTNVQVRTKGQDYKALFTQLLPSKGGK